MANKQLYKNKLCIYIYILKIMIMEGGNTYCHRLVGIYNLALKLLRNINCLSKFICT